MRFMSFCKIGTQVLVPVAGGMIELCSRKPVPKDDHIIDFIRTEATPMNNYLWLVFLLDL